MGFDETDPTARRRWEPEAQRERDTEVLALFRAGVSQRDIAKTMDCSLGTVQHVIRRDQKRAQRFLNRPADEPAESELLVKLERAEALAYLAADPSDELARYRLRHCRGTDADDEW